MAWTAAVGSVFSFEDEVDPAKVGGGAKRGARRVVINSGHDAPPSSVWLRGGSAERPGVRGAIELYPPCDASSMRSRPPAMALNAQRCFLTPEATRCAALMGRNSGASASADLRRPRWLTMATKLLLSWHVARADLIEDGGMDSRKQPQLTDLADGNGERGGDGLFGPVLRGEAFDGAPEVDRGHGRPHDVFAHRPHLVALVGVFDQDVDLGEADLYRDADPPGAVGDGELATLLGGGGRLQDANGFDVAASAASDSWPGWIVRGLWAFALRIRGSTRRSSI